MNIERIACVGAGLVGHSWATLFALKGYQVNMQSRKDSTLKKAMALIKSNMKFLRQKRMVKSEEVEGAVDRIETTGSIEEAVNGVDYVQESVAERYDVKKAVFKKMDLYAPDHAILASSSSGLLMSEIQKVTEKPQRCVLAHPWNPPILMPLVEIAGGAKTSRETVQTTYKLMLRLGKVPVIIRKEVPGYIANRIQAAVLREAIDLADKGIATVEEIDKAVSAGPGLRWALMGPFLTHHLGGQGIERFIETLGPSFIYRWKSMSTRTSIPPSTAKKIIEGVKQLEIVRSKRMEEISRWRDNKLVELLRIKSQNESTC